MNEDELQKKIEDYLEAVQELEETNKKSSSLEEEQKLFHEVMQNMGLSKADQEQLTQKGRDFVFRAKEHYAEGDFGHSKNLALKAEKLLPFDAAPKDILLQIYVHSPLQDPQKAIFYAQSILKITPKHPFAKKIAKQGSAKRIPIAMLVMSMIILMGAGGIFSLLVKTSPIQDPSLIENIPISPEETPPEKPLPVIIPETTTEIKIDTTETTELPSLDTPPSTLPVIFENLPKGFVIEDRGSKFSFYKKSFSFQYKGILHNKSQKELGTVEAELSLLDLAGNILTIKGETLKPSYEGVLRPGESFPLATLIYTKPLPKNYSHPAKAILRFIDVQATPTAAKVSKKEVPILWEGEKLEQFSLSAMLRTYKPSKYDSYSYHSLTYELKNDSKGIIKNLKMRCDFLNKDGNVIEKKEKIVTFSSRSAFYPNEIWPITFVAQITQEVHSIQLYIVDIQ